MMKKTDFLIIFVYGLAEDERGNIWCSTLKGINLIKVAENKIASYYSERGLVDNEYTIGASYQSMNGLIYLGGVKGITTFHPDSVTAQKREVDCDIIQSLFGRRSSDR